MKFLKNLFQKSKGEDDEDLEDNEDFDFEADARQAGCHLFGSGIEARTIRCVEK